MLSEIINNSVWKALWFTAMFGEKRLVIIASALVEVGLLQIISSLVYMYYIKAHWLWFLGCLKMTGTIFGMLSLTA